MLNNTRMRMVTLFSRSCSQQQQLITTSCFFHFHCPSKPVASAPFAHCRRPFSSSSDCKNVEHKKTGGSEGTLSKKPETNSNPVSYWQEQRQHIYDKMMSTVFRRQYSSSSSGANPPPEKLPPLMQFPQIMWPKVTFAIRNWFLANFIIRPHMDKEFDIREFDKGARQALSFISGCLAKGKLDELTGLVSNEALLEISENLQRLTLGQREVLAVDVEDIYFSFPYQIGIIIPDDPKPPPTNWVESGSSDSDAAPAKRPPQTRYVEITVAFHVLRGLSQTVQNDGQQRHFLEFLRQEDTKYKVMVCNYRFWKDFTEGVTDSSWIVNMVSHFLPAAEGK